MFSTSSLETEEFSFNALSERHTCLDLRVTAAWVCVCLHIPRLLTYHILYKLGASGKGWKERGWRGDLEQFQWGEEASLWQEKVGMCVCTRVWVCVLWAVSYRAELSPSACQCVGSNSGAVSNNLWFWIFFCASGIKTNVHFVLEVTNPKCAASNQFFLFTKMCPVDVFKAAPWLHLNICHL